MIPFLVKLANLLDDRGQYSMARDVDDLIVKLAEGTWLDTWMDSHKQLKPLLQSLAKQINAAIYAEGLGNAGKMAVQKLDEAVDWLDGLSPEKLTDEDVDEANRWGEYLDENVYGPLQKIIDAGNVTGTFTTRYYQLKDAIKPLIMEIARVSEGVRRQLASRRPAPQAKPAESAAPGEALKAPAAKHKKAPSAETQMLVAEIQKNLGMPQTGQWDKATNKKFIELMNSQPEYAKMMEGGKFRGTLQQAVQLTGQLAMLNTLDSSKPEQSQQGQASKAPVAVKQEDDSEVPPRNGPFGGPGFE